MTDEKPQVEEKSEEEELDWTPEEELEEGLYQMTDVPGWMKMIREGFERMKKASVDNDRLLRLHLTELQESLSKEKLRTEAALKILATLPGLSLPIGDPQYGRLQEWKQKVDEVSAMLKVD